VNFLLDPSLFAKQTPIQLVALAFSAVVGRHRIEIAPDARDEFTSWARKLGEAGDMVLRAEELSARESAHRESAITIRVMMREQSSWSKRMLTVDDALDLAHKPFRVLLENGVSDRWFLLATMSPEDRKWIEERVEHEWLELEGCGGIGELMKRVSSWALKDQNSLRCAALFDGDAVEPPSRHPESDEAFRARLGPLSQKVLALCEREPTIEDAGLLHHVLHRRAIENYLPDSALETWTKATGGAQRDERSCKREALRTCSHRHFYNMKNGYKGDRGRRPAPPTWLPSVTNHPLEEGFGSDISSFFAGVHVDDLDRSARAELRAFTTELLRRIR
jgi:hypothetical protein